MKMMVWSDHHSFFAVAQAETVEKARQAMLLEMGESGDGSCPERDAARETILNTPPSYWVGTNAEFALTTSAELREQENYNRTLCDQNQKLKKRIAELEAAREAPHA